MSYCCYRAEVLSVHAALSWLHCLGTYKKLKDVVVVKIQIFTEHFIWRIKAAKTEKQWLKRTYVICGTSKILSPAF